MLHRLDIARTEREATPARTHARELLIPVETVRATAGAAATAASMPGASAPVASIAVGSLLGTRYCVTGMIGKGGMGKVYRAYDHVLGQEVALKVVRDGADHALLREEVRLAQRVTHHNVCRIFDLETIDEVPVIKMEYIRGGSLAERLARGPLAIDRAIAITRAIGAGLAAAHARGIVHRDLKPGNVMLDGERVVLVDFGLAQLEGVSDLSGTPGYMSPEQLAGGAIDASSDLYALGCLAFEMLTGAPPFGFGTIAEMATRQAHAAPDVRAFRRDVPRWLARAIALLLARDPARRSRGVALLARGRAMPRFAMAAVAVVLLAALGVRTGAHAAPVWEPEVADLPQFDENADAPMFSPDGSAIAFSSDRGHRDVWSVYVAGERGEPRQVSADGQFCVAGRWTRDGRAIMMSCFVRGEWRIVRRAPDGSSERDLGPGWSVDDCGDALAVVVTRPTGSALVLRHPDGRDEVVVGVTGDGLSQVRCARAGNRLLYLRKPMEQPNGGGPIVIVDRQHDTARQLTDLRALDATFTPDGASVIATVQRGSRTSLFEIGVESGGVHELTPHEDDALSPDVSRDGRLLFDRDRTSVPLFELTASGAVERTFHFESLSHLVAAPRGDILVASREDHEGPTLVAIALADYAERSLGTGEPLLVSRDGRVVFTTPGDPTTLRAIATGGGPVARLATLPAPIIDAAEGPDGLHVELDRGESSEAWLVARDGRVVPEGSTGLVMPAPAGGWRVVQRTIGSQVTLQFVPPGRPLGAVAFERTAVWGVPAWTSAHELAYCDVATCRRVDVTTGRDVATTHVETPGNRPITVGPDGTRWFVTSFVGHVTRHVITNFNDRPWAR